MYSIMFYNFVIDPRNEPKIKQTPSYSEEFFVQFLKNNSFSTDLGQDVSCDEYGFVIESHSIRVFTGRRLNEES